jgi:hypothetical protein
MPGARSHCRVGRATPGGRRRRGAPLAASYGWSNTSGCVLRDHIPIAGSTASSARTHAASCRGARGRCPCLHSQMVMSLSGSRWLVDQRPERYGRTRTRSLHHALTPTAMCTERTALAPSPTAAAARFIEPWRTSPAGKTPGTLVSKGRGLRPSADQVSPSSSLVSWTSVRTKPCSSRATPVSQLVAGSAPMNQ